jgi:hypothetical protein
MQIGRALGFMFLGSHVAWAGSTDCGAIPVSPFWENLDRLCAVDIPSTSSTDLVTATTLQEVRTYCGTKGRPVGSDAPVFAAGPEVQRMERLLAIAASLGQTRRFVQAQVVPSAPPLLDLLAQLEDSDRENQMDVGTNAPAAELQNRVCEDETTSLWLPSVCRPLPVTGTVADLRKRLLRDALLLVAKAANKASEEAGTNEALELLAAVVEAALQSVEPWYLGAHMAQAISGNEEAEIPCSPSRALADLPTGTGEPVKIAGRVISVVSLDGSDFRRPLQHYVRVVARVLEEEGMLPGNHALTGERADAVGRLVTGLGDARLTGQRLMQDPTSPELVRSLLTAWGIVIEHAMTISTGHRYVLPASWISLSDALATASLLRVAEGVNDLAHGTPLVSLKAIDAIGSMTSILAGSSDSERRRDLRGQLLGLVPWTEPILFDVNLGTVIVDVRNLNAKFAGDIAIGYNGGLGGAIVRGNAYGYEYTEAGVSSRNTYRAGADVEGWLSPGSEETKVDLRVKVGYSRFDTDLAGEAAGADVFSDETSEMTHATLLAGVRVAPSSGFALGVWGGGGGQFESFNSLLVDQNGNASVDDGEKLTGKVDGRLRIQATLWPQVLVGRLRADVEWFKLSTASFVLDATGTTTALTVEASQTEIDTRAYVDLEIARFAGFVPSLSGGLNYFAVSASGGISESTINPVIAAGIRRDVF